MPFLPPNQQCQSTEVSYRLLKCTDINTVDCVDCVNSDTLCLRRWIAMQLWITNNSNNEAYSKHRALTEILRSTISCHSNKTHATACTNCKSTQQCTTRGHPLAFPQVTSRSVRERGEGQTDRHTHIQTAVTAIHFTLSTTRKM